MNNQEEQFIKINSINELHALMGLESPLNPLVTIIDHSQTQNNTHGQNKKLVFDFYNITIKRGFKGLLKYGKNTYDFDEGTMLFIAPNQIFAIDNTEEQNSDGWYLFFHPDLIRRYALGMKRK